MRLTRWHKQDTQPRQLGRLRGEMDRLFDRFFMNPWDPMETAGGWKPEIELSETDQEITVTVELPGLDPKDVDIQVVGDVLTITGDKKEEKEDQGKEFHHSEIRYGMFRRDIALPAVADPDNIKADYNKGVLRVRIGKDKASVPRRIPIESAEKQADRSVEEDKPSIR